MKFGEPESSIKFKLIQNYPNPFNPAINIVFDIREGDHVTLEIYDLAG